MVNGIISPEAANGKIRTMYVADQELVQRLKAKTFFILNMDTHNLLTLAAARIEQLSTSLFELRETLLANNGALPNESDKSNAERSDGRKESRDPLHPEGEDPKPG
jgi:hypothetical protein